MLTKGEVTSTCFTVWVAPSFKEESTSATGRGYIPTEYSQFSGSVPDLSCRPSLRSSIILSRAFNVSRWRPQRFSLGTFQSFVCPIFVATAYKRAIALVMSSPEAAATVYHSVLHRRRVWNQRSQRRRFEN
jgi:hypothetical protein